MSTANQQTAARQHTVVVAEMDSRDAVQNSIYNNEEDGKATPSQNGNKSLDKVMDKDRSPTQETTVKIHCEIFRKNRFLEKIVFVISVTTLVIIALCLMNIHWFLPYYYAISTPALLVIRIMMYWKNKWQYFLIDFCYFANIFCYIFIWIVPSDGESSAVLFAIANGPLAWATVMFRNAFVFHDVDRMTSCYIHVLPMALSFGLRWYPNEMSLHWYKSFNAEYADDVQYMFIWVFAVPLGCFIFHSCLYLLLVFGICKPDETYLNSLRYLASRRNSWQGKTLYACGEKYLLLTFTLFNALYSSCSLLLTILLYKFYVAHVTYIAIIVLIVTWNGATFYLDVFANRGSKPKS